MSLLKNILRFVIFLFLPLSSYAQLVVTGGLTATQMANIIAGPGITVTNAVYNGPAISAGSFNGSASNIGIPSGVIITCGDINLAVGPNTLGSAGIDNFSPGNPELNQLAGATTYDAATLEFDFVAQSNSVQFRYVFGSEEYPEWVSSGYNDAFAFFISGPGIPGNQNIALVPGTGQPVTIDNINAFTNSAYYVNNAGGASVQYDAFTTVLTATRQVQACQTYHLKMTIADAGDGIYDSGVFIQENSLISNVVSITASTINSDSTAWEGCSNATVTFTLGTTSPNPTTINYSVSGTATNGTDYTNLPGSITIPANTLSNSFTITPVADGIPEGIETIIVAVQTSICSWDTIIVYIDDLDPLTVNAIGDTTLCTGQGQATLTAIPSGGGGGYTYSWSNGATTASINVSPGSTTTYTVTVNDMCGVNSVTDTVTVTIAGAPNANAGPDVNYCAGDAVTLTAAGGTNYRWFRIPSNTQVGTTASITINPVGNEIYYVEASVGGCIDYDTVQVIENPAAVANAGSDVSICGGATAQLSASGGVSYSWSPANDLNNPNISNPVFSGNGTTTLTVTVTDLNGCVDTDDVMVSINPAPPANAGADIFVCLGMTGQLNGSGGVTYSWSPSTDLDNPNIANPVFSGLATTNYTLTVTDNNGCTATDDVTVNIVQSNPVADFTMPTSVCLNDNVNITFTGTASQSAIFIWNFNGGTVVSGSGSGPYTVFWTTPGTKTVRCIVDENGCGSDTISYNIDVFSYPIANAGADQSECSGITISIGSSSFTGETYSWNPTTGLSASNVSNPDLTTSNLTSSTIVIPYVVTVTSANGCVSSDTVLITVFPTPIANFTAPPGECLDVNSLDFTAGGTFGNNATFLWDFGLSAIPSNSTQQNPTGIMFTTHGNFPVSLTITENGCTSLPAVQTVDIYQMPVADFSANPTEGCEPLLVHFTDLSDNAGSNLLHDWKFGDNNISSAGNPSNRYLTAGTFTVQLTVTTSEGCSDTEIKPAYITVYPKPVAAFKANPETVSIFDPVIYFTDQSSGANSCEYHISMTGNTINTCNFSYTFPDTGYYTITQYVYSIHGCSDTAQLDIYVKPEFTFYIPSAFSPNSDFKNDVYYGYGTFIKNYEFRIFNRWGELIFFTDQLDKGWDGTFKGYNAQEDVYVYKVNIVDVIGEKHQFIGHVTLFR